MLCECFIMYRTAVNNNNKKVMIKNGTLHGHVTMYFCLKTFKSSFIIRVLPVSMLSQKEFWEVVMGTQHMPLSVPFPVDQFPAKMYCNNTYF